MSNDLLTRVADKLRADAQFGYGNPDMQLIRDLAARVRELEAAYAAKMKETVYVANERDALRRENDALRALITDFAAAFDSPCPNMQQWAHIKAKAREVRAALARGEKP